MNTTSKKALATIFLIALFLVSVAVIHLIITKQKDTAETVALNPTQIILEGTYDCLPYKATAPVENRVCDFGLITIGGDMYDLDFNRLPLLKLNVKGGDRVKVQGILTSIESVSSEYLTKRYTLHGVLTITDSFEILSKEDITSNGFISFKKPEDFGLALNPKQILVASYIPPCSNDFEYCLYYNGTEYIDTNFGSAGIRIQKREELNTVNTCIYTPPAGYEVFKPTRVSTTSAYTLGVYNIGDAGMSHYATGELYRLYYKDVCHEFETRISATQFAVYPEGTKVEFKDTIMRAKLRSILNEMQLAGGENLVL